MRERERDPDGSGQKQLLLLTKRNSDNSGPTYATECCTSARFIQNIIEINNSG